MPRRIQFALRQLILASVATVLVACGGGSSEPQDLVRGTVQSGVGATAQPIPNALVTLYRAVNGVTVAVAQTTALADGSFSLSTNTAVSGSYFVVATQGSQIKLMAVLGTHPMAKVVVNELTTVAGGYAFAAFFQNGLIVGPNLPLQIASGMAANIADPSTGAISDLLQRSPNAYETNAFQLVGSLGNLTAACVRNPGSACADLLRMTPSMNGVAATDTLQALANLARQPAQNLRNLFALSLTQRVYAPALGVDQGPDASDYLKALDAFTIALKFNDSGSSDCPFGGPANVAFDANGFLWITNNVVQGTPGSAKCQIVLKPNGQPADGSDGTPKSPVTGGGILGQAFGIAIDRLGNVWSSNFGWGGVLPPEGSATKTTGTGAALSPATGIIAGTYRVQGIGVDSDNNIWLASYGNNKVVVLPKGNADAAVAYADSNETPFGLVIDQNGDAWVTYTSSSAVSKLRYSNGSLQKVFTTQLPASSGPKGLAIDSAGSAWVAAGGSSAVYVINSTGTLTNTLTGSGIAAPWGISIDASDNVWVANFGDASNRGVRYSVVQMCGTRIQNCPAGATRTTVLSPANGYTLPSGGAQVLLANGKPLYYPSDIPSYKPLMRLTSANVDMAGNVWAANNWKPVGPIDLTSNPGGDGVVAFVGVGTPTRAPTLGPARPIE